MNIFAIFLLLIIVLSYKLKFKISFNWNGLHGKIIIKVLFIKIKKDISLFGHKGKKGNIIELKSIIKQIEVEEFKVNVLSGLLFLKPTILSVLLISIGLECLKTLKFKKLKYYYYKVKPCFDEKLVLSIRANLVFKVHLFILLKYVALLFFKHFSERNA